MEAGAGGDPAVVEVEAGHTYRLGAVEVDRHVVNGQPEAPSGGLRAGSDSNDPGLRIQCGEQHPQLNRVGCQQRDLFA